MFQPDFRLHATHSVWTATSSCQYNTQPFLIYSEYWQLIIFDNLLLCEKGSKLDTYMSHWTFRPVCAAVFDDHSPPQLDCN